MSPLKYPEPLRYLNGKMAFAAKYNDLILNSRTLMVGGEKQLQKAVL